MAGFHRRPRSVLGSLRLTLVALSALLVSSTALAEPGPNASPTTAEPTADSGVGAEALTLPELTQLCQRLREPDPAARREAAERIIAAGPASVQTIRLRLRRDLLAAPGDLERLLDRLSPDVHSGSMPPRGDVPPFDLLPPLLAEQGEDDDARRTLAEAVEVVTLLRALTAVGDTPATRLLIQHGTRERGVFKAEVARDVLRLGTQALPAVLLTTRHPDDGVARFGTALLEWLHWNDTGSQVQVRDPAALAEVLAVFGELADRDKIPVLISFSGSEHAAVREAARASLLRYGPSILWPARAQYESFTGQEPNRSWGWQELARQLFEAQDRARMAQAEQAMEEGLRLAAARDYAAMLTRYDQVLSRWPRYERRSEMVPGLLAYAEELDGRRQREEATRLRARALLLAPEGADADALRARLELDDAERALARGIADPAQLDRIERTAPGVGDGRIARLQTRIAARTERHSPYFYRLVAVVGLALFALGCLGLFVVRALMPGRAKVGGSEKEGGERKGGAGEKL